MRVLVSGSSGLIGSALVRALEARGDEVLRLVRSGEGSRTEIPWKPAAGVARNEALEGLDAIVHLAGAGIADKRWSDARKKLLVSSRVDATSALVESLSPLRPDVVRGTDLLILRELTGGVYFGKPSHNRPDQGLSTMVYDRHEVERIARTAFETAELRGGYVTNVDKANVLDVSQFWRDVVVGVHQAEFSQVALDHLYVDNAAMQIARQPTQFDTVVTSNIFGDILSDLAAVIPGSLGVLPSASLGGSVGLYEPVHGSAPDIAGQDLANPVGTMLSVAMLLRHSFGAVDAAAEVELAVQRALADDPTRDLGGTRGTRAFTDAVIEALAPAAAAD